MQNYNLNRYEQALVNTFIAMLDKILKNDAFIDFEHVQIECARLLLIEASKTKKAPRTYVCDTFGKDRHWLHKKNL